MQVTRRGLLQATVCCGILAMLAATPVDMITLTVPLTPKDPLEKAKEQLSQFISETFHQPYATCKRIVEVVYQYADKAKLPPELILAIIAQESSFKQTARSKYGAIGLMQVVPRWHPEKIKNISHPDGLYHPESNIAVGVLILKQFITRARGDIPEALKRYSGEATLYAHKVDKYYKTFSKVADPSLEDTDVSLMA